MGSQDSSKEQIKIPHTGKGDSGRDEPLEALHECINYGYVKEGGVFPVLLVRVYSCKMEEYRSVGKP